MFNFAVLMAAMIPIRIQAKRASYSSSKWLCYNQSKIQYVLYLCFNHLYSQQTSLYVEPANAQQDIS
jgi:hypothetical protein